ncbi:6641_t:CDS:2 [Gigaspora margarita]|uniref:6641_t:CDS:1 n=1 Tax=Gigaspora margarita TaxID=4874 RepID=A0ABN7VD74_GIGMA|nr:6641_t:CDS:2 [Gigaspora margarita]
MSAKQKIFKDEYAKLFKTGVNAYKINDYKSSYNCFSSIAKISNNLSNYKYEAKIWLASYFSSKKDYQKAFEFYLDIYYGKPPNIRGIELLLAESVEKGLGDFKNDEKAFNFYLGLYTNVPEYRRFARNCLIKCYNLGIGVSKDEEKVYKLENKALNDFEKEDKLKIKN